MKAGSGSGMVTAGSNELLSLKGGALEISSYCHVTLPHLQNISLQSCINFLRVCVLGKKKSYKVSIPGTEVIVHKHLLGFS